MSFPPPLLFWRLAVFLFFFLVPFLYESLVDYFFSIVRKIRVAHVGLPFHRGSFSELQCDSESLFSSKSGPF